MEAIDAARKHEEFLLQNFKGGVNEIEGEKGQTVKMMAETKKETSNIAKVRFGKRRVAMLRNLQILKSESELSKPTPKEIEFCKQFVGQVASCQQTIEHLNKLLDAHVGDFEREIKKVLKTYNIRIEAYHGGSLVGNHCMFMSENGDGIFDDLAAAISPRLSDPTNKTYLEAICIRMKEILKLWFEIMKTMKSAQYQDDAACEAFRTNTKALNKEINSLINDPPIPGCGLKLSQQLKSHLLFDWEIQDFLELWRTLGGGG